MPEHRDIIDRAEAVWSDPANNWRRLIERAFAQLSPGVIEKFVANFLVNASLVGVPRGHELGEQLQCNIPWAILMDPTSDCNLRCKGCWAEEYDRGASLTLEELDSIITQGKDLGVYSFSIPVASLCCGPVTSSRWRLSTKIACSVLLLTPP